MLRYVNDSTRTVYAIEMMPPPQLDDVGTEANEVITGTGDVTSSSDVPPNNMMSPTSKPKPEPDDVFSNMGNFSVTADTVWDKVNKDCDVTSGGRTLEFEANILNNLADSSGPASNRWTGFQDNMLVVTADSTSTSIQDSSQVDTGVQTWQMTMDAQVGSTSGNWDVESVVVQPADSGHVKEKVQIGDVHMGNDDAQEVVKTDQWRSCAICLEEMADCDLMVHTVCEGTLCQSCLEVGTLQLVFSKKAASLDLLHVSVKPITTFPKVTA